MRVLLISCDNVPPAPSDHGSNGVQVIRAGLIAGLLKNGVTSAFYAANELTSGGILIFNSAREALSISQSDFWCNQPVSGAPARQALRRAIDQFRPDVLLVYDVLALRLARHTAPEILTGIISVDLEYISILLRYYHNMRYGGFWRKLKSIVATPRQVLLAMRTHYEVRRYYPAADFIINHAANHAAWHKKMHHRPTLYVPNPVTFIEDVPPRNPTRPAKFIMVGGIRGISTLAGLVWFARNVYPRLEPAIVEGKLELHLIGNGELEPSIRMRMPRVVVRGFVRDLSDEFATATALLVPTPIKLGFRTRILDGFRHSIAVIAHAANTVGMPELVNGKNALVASSGDQFAEAIRKLIDDPSEAERLGRAGYSDFASALNADAGAKRILEFIGLQRSSTQQRS
jgi:glycosyltransferase involved in cell wall biosynthesis